jgi:hypothetical protein
MLSGTDRKENDFFCNCEFLVEQHPLRRASTLFLEVRELSPQIALLITTILLCGVINERF